MEVVVLGSALCAGLFSAIAHADAVDLRRGAPPAALRERGELLGDMGGLRAALSAHGLTLAVQEISEVLCPTTGTGTSTSTSAGAHYEGVTVLDLGLDTDEAFHRPGGTLNVSVLQIHGSRVDTATFNDLQHVSGIAANRTTRLWEQWYQEVLSGGMADIRISQQSLDQEFIISQYSGAFMNSMMGWPMLPSTDRYAGGPAFPLSSLGVRLRLQAAPAWTLICAPDGRTRRSQSHRLQPQCRHGHECTACGPRRSRSRVWLEPHQR